LLFLDSVAVVAVVPAVPIVAVVPEVPEVAVELIVPVPLVSAEMGTVVSIVAVVAVVADTEVLVDTVSVLVFSCFLQPNASIATASKAKSVIEKDFFIAEFSFSIRHDRGITAGGRERNPRTWRYIRNVVANVKRSCPSARPRLALGGLL